MLSCQRLTSWDDRSAKRPLPATSKDERPFRFDLGVRHVLLAAMCCSESPSVTTLPSPLPSLVSLGCVAGLMISSFGICMRCSALRGGEGDFLFSTFVPAFIREPRRDEWHVMARSTRQRTDQYLACIHVASLSPSGQTHARCAWLLLIDTSSCCA